MMRTTDPFEREMVACMPSLKAYAISLTHSTERAEDLVQETMLRALGARDSFTPGSNMSAWLFTILRNYFRSEYRKRKREVEDVDEAHALRLSVPAEQELMVYFKEVMDAVGQLPERYRESLMTIAEGTQYNNASELLSIAEGTVKSRINRARHMLEKRLVKRPTSRAVAHRETVPRDVLRAIRKPVAPAAPPIQPVRRYVQGSAEWEQVAAKVASSHPVSSTRQQIHKSVAKKRTADLLVCGVVFVLSQTHVLPDGSVQRIFRAA